MVSMVNTASLPIALPAAYPLVGLGISSLFLLNIFQQYYVVSARKESKVSYPTLYVSEEAAKADPLKYKYNCTQRAHQNTLEAMPFIVGMTLFLGIFKPVTAAALCGSWAFGRIFYTMGYSAGDPAKRTSGLSKVQYIGMFGLLFTTLYVSVQKSYALYF